MTSYVSFNDKGQDISVIVPVYNGERSIALCIEALLKQTITPKDIFIIDNNSNDCTRDIVRQYPVVLLEEKDIQTSYAARNKGLKHAQSELVALTDADCIPELTWIEELVAHFASSDVIAVAGRIDDYEPKTAVERFMVIQKPFKTNGSHNYLSLLTGNVAYRREALELLGWFDESLPTAGDVDLGWRLRIWNKGCIANAPGAIVHHWHRSTLKGMFNQYKRYGYSEILLSTLYKNCVSETVRPREQMTRMAKQVRALLTYHISFLWRLVRYPFIGESRDWLIWPLMWIIVESANLAGKIKGLIATRWFHRNPYPSRPEIRRCPDR